MTIDTKKLELSPENIITDGVITDFKQDINNAKDANNLGLSAVLQKDGKLVVVGFSTNNDNDFALVRYNVDGSLDASFDGNGIVEGNGKFSTDFGSDDRSFSVTMIDNKIVVAGRSGSHGNFTLAQYNGDGTLDTSFGSDQDGTVISGFGAIDWEDNNEIGDYVGSYVVKQSDGKLVVAGSEQSDEKPAHFALTRYNSDGSVDTTFGTLGKATHNYDGYSVVRSVILQQDDKIVVAGYEHTGVGIGKFGYSRDTCKNRT